MFQINFVDHDEPFYQLDNNPVYKLRCRLYDYSSEIIDTGITAIDAIETEQSQDALSISLLWNNQLASNEDIDWNYARCNVGLLLEETDGDNIIGEDDETSVGDKYSI